MDGILDFDEEIFEGRKQGVERAINCVDNLNYMNNILILIDDALRSYDDIICDYMPHTHVLGDLGVDYEKCRNYLIAAPLRMADTYESIVSGTQHCLSLLDYAALLDNYYVIPDPNLDVYEKIHNYEFEAYCSKDQLSFSDFLPVDPENYEYSTTMPLVVEDFAILYQKEYDDCKEQLEQQYGISSLEEYNRMILEAGQFYFEKTSSLGKRIVDNALTATLIYPLVTGILRYDIHGPLSRYESSSRIGSSLFQVTVTLATGGFAADAPKMLSTGLKALYYFVKHIVVPSASAAVETLTDEAITHLTDDPNLRLLLPPIIGEGTKLLFLAVNQNVFNHISTLPISNMLKKYGFNISVDDYLKILDMSFKNQDCIKAMLGKFDDEGVTSYISRAGKDYQYFDMGDDWDAIRQKYNLSNDQMFDLFNKPFLDKVIKDGYPVQFSHDPTSDRATLRKEFDYLLANDYTYDPDTMAATPIGR